jgi:hypothetical protein
MRAVRNAVERSKGGNGMKKANDYPVPAKRLARALRLPKIR